MAFERGGIGCGAISSNCTLTWYTVSTANARFPSFDTYKASHCCYTLTSVTMWSKGKGISLALGLICPLLVLMFTSNSSTLPLFVCERCGYAEAPSERAFNAHVASGCTVPRATRRREGLPPSDLVPVPDSSSDTSSGSSGAGTSGTAAAGTRSNSGYCADMQAYDSAREPGVANQAALDQHGVSSQADQAVDAVEHPASPKRQRTDPTSSTDPWSSLADAMVHAAQDLGLQLDHDRVAEAMDHMHEAAGEWCWTVWQALYHMLCGT